jgi:hypothetical protein
VVAAEQFGLSCTRPDNVTPEAKLSPSMRRILPDGVFDNGIKKRLGLEEVCESLMSKRLPRDS